MDSTDTQIYCHISKHCSKIISYTLQAAVFFILLAILLFVASGFLAHDVKILKDTTACKKFELFKLDSRCEQLITGTVSFFFEIFFSVKVSRHIFKQISRSLLDILTFRTVNFKNKLVLNCSFTLTFSLSNYDSFGDQCSVVMATLAYKSHSSIMLRRQKRSTVTPNFIMPNSF